MEELVMEEFLMNDYEKPLPRKFKIVKQYYGAGTGVNYVGYVWAKDYWAYVTGSIASTPERCEQNIRYGNFPPELVKEFEL